MKKKIYYYILFQKKKNQRKTHDTYTLHLYIHLHQRYSKHQTRLLHSMPTRVGMQEFFTYLHLYQSVVNSTHRPLHDRNEFLHGQMASLNPYKEALEVNY